MIFPPIFKIYKLGILVSRNFNTEVSNRRKTRKKEFATILFRKKIMDAKGENQLWLIICWQIVKVEESVKEKEVGEYEKVGKRETGAEEEKDEILIMKF